MKLLEMHLNTTAPRVPSNLGAHCLPCHGLNLPQYLPKLRQESILLNTQN